MSIRFGTDGLRGRARVELTADLVRRLGAAAADVLGGDHFVIGRDTRESGPELEGALLEGLSARGVAGELLGVVPTPTVAWVCAADRVSGAMISASHNPYHDNGVKLFAPGGVKLSDAVQAQIQARLDSVGEVRSGPVRTADAAGVVARYQQAVAASLDGRDLAGLRVVIDCANGAASEVAPPVLESLGVHLTVLAAAPDGHNINAQCGSTHPAALQRAVIDLGADAGLAFDGDADRVLAVDAHGSLVDGDQIIAVCALDRKARGQLTGDAVVVTVMTNLGFRLGMQSAGIRVVETAVGDRYVLEALESEGLSLGGEQSGHVIFRDLAGTGDGLLTGVQLLDVVNRRHRPLDELAGAAMERLPQVLHNVWIERHDPDLVERLAPVVREVEASLGERGRVLIRPSGTEPLIRVMVEAGTRDAAESAASRLVAEVGRSASSGTGI